MIFVIFMDSAVSMIFGSPGGGPGGPKGGPPKGPPPILGAIFHQNDQNTIGFISKSEKVKSLLECPESDSSFLPIIQ